MKRIIALTLCLCLLLMGCGTTDAGPAQIAAESETSVAPDHVYSTQVFAMDTYMDLKAYGQGAEPALAAVSELLKRLDGCLSVTDEHSEIHAVNHSGGAAVTVSAETAALLQGALTLSQELGPAFELTLYPVSEAWGFTSGAYRVPAQDELAKLLQLVDDSKINIAGNEVRLPDGMELDLGAVAKGYAGDLAAAILAEHGVTSGLLNLGSSTIRAVGVKPDGSKWRIAIQDPENPEAYAGVVEVENCAVDTSGGYERYFEEDGKIYWHILDPETGYPAHSGLSSVTVLSADSLMGDGLSTALFVMGLDKAVEYWRENGGFEFILIGEDGGLYVSQGAAEQFTPAGDYENMPLTVIPYEE